MIKVESFIYHTRFGEKDFHVYPMRNERRWLTLDEENYFILPRNARVYAVETAPEFSPDRRLNFTLQLQQFPGALWISNRVVPVIRDGKVELTEKRKISFNHLFLGGAVNGLIHVNGKHRFEPIELQKLIEMVEKWGWKVDPEILSYFSKDSFTDK